MIQILKHREYFDKKTNKNNTTFQRLYLDHEPSSVQDLFLNIEKYIDQIPKEERYNLHFTLCENRDPQKRSFARQNIIPFDIDGIDVSRIEDYEEPILDAIGVNPGDVAYVHSGRGIHVYVGGEYIDDPAEFERTKAPYGLLCDRIDKRLESRLLPGHADKAIWCKNRTLRLPETENRKKKHDFIGKCTLVARVINLMPELTINSLSGVPKVVVGDYIEVKGSSLGGKYVCDTEAVLSQCEFLKYCKDNQSAVLEPQWYAMLSIVPHLEDGMKLAHSLSEKHPSYDYEETNTKIDQALGASGPRKCSNIDSVWEGCKKCKHYGKITSPITIKSEDFIKTKATGFRDPGRGRIGTDSDGSAIMGDVTGKVNYDDLKKYFMSLNPTQVTENGHLYRFNGTCYKLCEKAVIHSFVETHVKPSPNHNNCLEFEKKMRRVNEEGEYKVINQSWFEDTTYKKMNLKNGVLDLSGDEPILLPHSSSYGFMSMQPYNYDPSAKCPKFDKFMKEVTCRRDEIIKRIMEFAGYAFTNEACIYGKCLLLLGEGANGKSTLINVFKRLAGKDSYSALTANKFSCEKSLYMLRGKLFNIAEETPKKSLMDSSTFKNIVTGGEVVARKLYHDIFNFEVRAKLIMAANELPTSFDLTKGYFRRLDIIPFDAEFSKEKGNVDVRIEDKLMKEAPGILNRILEGAKRLKKQGEFTASTNIDQIIKSYQMDSDPILSFMEEKLRIENINGNKDGDSVNYIYDNYASYCRESGFHPLNKNNFSKKLLGHLPDKKNRAKKKNDIRIYDGVFIGGERSF